jgi:HAD superfamily hydrolase (TIGR01509 family)
LTQKIQSNLKKALIFDLDGLIMETEAAYCRIWQRKFRKAGLDFDLKSFQKLVGAHHVAGGYRPDEVLAAHLNNGVTAVELRKAVSIEARREIFHTEALPGVMRVLEDAEARGLHLAVGSSSEEYWVHGHLKRLGIFERFGSIVSSSDVKDAKPAPDIFLKVLEDLGVEAENALVLEDSNNGVVAAHRAGIRVVAVPNEVTRGQDFSLAAAIIPSLELLDLDAFFPEG